MLLDSDSIGDIYTPLKGIRDLPSSPPEERVPIPKLRVEVPLVLSESPSGSLWKRKSVSFNEALTEIIPNLPGALPELERDAMIDDIDAFFDATIKPIALKAERRIEQEQLQEADTTRRISVPIMDFSLPVAPWNIPLQRSRSDSADITQDRILQEVKTLHFKNHAWLLSGKAERELQWTPFAAAIGKVESQETIHDDGTLATFLTQPHCIDTYTLTWKLEGLRLLDEVRRHDEEELEEGSLPEGKDLESLVRKRKLDLRDDEQASSASRPNRMKASQTFRILAYDNLPHLGSLGDFIHARTGADRESFDSVKQDPPINTIGQEQAIDKGCHQSQDQPTGESWTVASPIAPLPEIMTPGKRQAFIVSATFLRDRKLVRQIQRMFPLAELIERDWSLHVSPRPVLRALNSGQPTASLDTMADEADIIMSPSTGLIWTTLQKIKQQALPGQAARSIIRERVRRTASKYGRLIVLISDYRQPSGYDQSRPRSAFDISDCEAVAHFTAFCYSLEDETQAIFVAGGSEELSRWIVTVMIKYSGSNSNIRLIQDETLWEVFLRRAGMNAFAAQAILGKLNEKIMEESGSSDFGLTAFVKMSEVERFAKFEGMLGGIRLLSRINKVLDAKW